MLLGTREALGGVLSSRGRANVVDGEEGARLGRLGLSALRLAESHTW